MSIREILVAPILNAMAPTIRRLEGLIETLAARETQMQRQMDKIREEVAETRGVAQSAITLVKRLAEEIRDRKGDEAALEALAAELDQSNAELAAAVQENSPTEEPPADEPPAEDPTAEPRTEPAPTEGG